MGGLSTTATSERGSRAVCGLVPAFSGSAWVQFIHFVEKWPSVLVVLYLQKGISASLIKGEGDYTHEGKAQDIALPNSFRTCTFNIRPNCRIPIASINCSVRVDLNQMQLHLHKD